VGDGEREWRRKRGMGGRGVRVGKDGVSGRKINGGANFSDGNGWQKEIKTVTLRR